MKVKIQRLLIFHHNLGCDEMLLKPMPSQFMFYPDSAKDIVSSNLQTLSVVLYQFKVNVI